MKNYVILVTGLLSSFPLFSWWFKSWARKLKKRINKKYPDVEVVVVTSDGRRAVHNVWLKLRTDAENRRLGKVVICGHSNGYRDGLFLADDIYPHQVEYFGGIDLTLADNDVEVPGNVKVFDNFHATLTEAPKFSKKFKGEYTKFKIDDSHIGSASNRFVQDKMFTQIRRVFGA